MTGETRTQKASQFTNNEVTTLGDYWAEVRSQSDPDKTYTVDLSGDDPSCTCPDHRYRGTSCKHILAAADELGVISLPESDSR